jgi:hypothetical protein
MLSIALVITVGICATIIALWRPLLSVACVAFLLPWQGLDLDVGIRVTAVQLFMAPLALRCSWDYLAKRSGGTRKVLPGLVSVFVVYSLTVSIFQLPFLPTATVSGGDLRSPISRAMLQLFVFLLSISPIFFIPLICNGQHQVVKLFKYFVTSCLMLAILGWLQMAVWYSTGLNLFPIGLLDTLLETQAAALAREGQFIYEGVWVYRMNSLGGEPKNLGAALVFAMMLLIILKDRLFKSPAQRNAVLAFFAASVFATLSTTAFYLLAIGLFVSFTVAGASGALDVRNLRINQLFNFGAFALFATASISVLQLMMQSWFGGADVGVLDFLFERTINREGSVLEDFDSGILEFMFQNPLRGIFGVGLGNIHLYADTYLDPITAAYAGGGVFVAKAGYLRLISELGVVGLGLLTLAVVSCARPNRYVNTTNFSLAKFPSMQLAITTLVMALAATSGPELYFVLGCLAAQNFQRASVENPYRAIFDNRSELRPESGNLARRSFDS